MSLMRATSAACSPSGAETTTLLDATLSPGELRRLRFRAMVPGLTSIPQAFTVEVF